jgi:hypothetical protein
MTDELTDAVRRLKELQSDVERLKAARDQEGEPRLFFETSEIASATDRQADLRLQRTVVGASYGSAGYNTSTYNE